MTSQTNQTNPENKQKCIGIDLGTTYSCVAFYDSDGKVIVIVNENGNRITPSYVAFQGNERYVGDTAKKNSGMNPKNTIYDIKRLMGIKFSDTVLQNELKHLSYNVVKGDNDKPLVEVDYMDSKKQFHPEQISAMILEKLKDQASKYLGYEVRKAVITVPAYFNDSQRQATKDAGEIAGLEVIRIINEPTAAAIAYGLNNNKERNVIVYDLGGGTLDVTILKMDEGIFKVKSTSGDVHLGGEDFDNKLKDYVFMKFCDKHILKTKLSSDEKKRLFDLLGVKSLAGIQSYGEKKLTTIIATISNLTEQNIKDYIEQLITVNKLYSNPKLLRRLKTACEDAKKTLSTMISADIVYENFYDGQDLNVNITRNKFVELCDSEFKRCMAPVEKALSDAKMAPIQIDDVVLVGGSTRIPKVQELLNEMFPNKLRTNINPDEAVAHGAAINGAIITDTGDKVTDGIVLIDVTPLSLGLETVGGVMEVMIKRNTPLPAEAKQVFTTHTNNQPSVTIKVFEGERAKTKDNNLLGKFEMTNLPMMEKGRPRIEVTFTIDTNGIMSVSAKELTSGIENSITIKNEKGRLSTDDIGKMIEQAEKFKDNDKKILDRSQAKNSLDSYMNNIKKIVSSEEFKSIVEDDVMTEIISTIQDISNWMDDIETDEDEYEKITKDDYDVQYKSLEKIVLPILEKMNQNNIKVKGKKDKPEQKETHIKQK